MLKTLTATCSRKYFMCIRYTNVKYEIENDYFSTFNVDISSYLIVQHRKKRSKKTFHVYQSNALENTLAMHR